MAEVYNQSSVHNTEIMVTLKWYVQRILELAPKGSLLELGIGFGESTRLFSEHFTRHVVIDSSQEVISQFKKSHDANTVQIVMQRFEDFWTEEHFDTIVMGFVLEHVDDPAMILSRFAHFLAPGGHLFITVPNARSLHRLIGNAAGLLHNVYALSEYDKKAGHQRYFDRESVAAMIEACGFNILQCEGILLKPITSSQMKQLEFDKTVFNALCRVGVDLPEISNSILFHAVKSSTAP